MAAAAVLLVQGLVALQEEVVLRNMRVQQQRSMMAGLELMDSGMQAVEDLLGAQPVAVAAQVRLVAIAVAQM